MGNDVNDGVRSGGEVIFAGEGKAPKRKTNEELIESMATKETTARDELFCCYLHAIQEELHATARDKGWWDAERNDGELIALIHSELSELLEALRHGNPPDAKLPEFTSAEIEASDVMIRLLDMAEARGWRLGEAVLAKAEYNRGREWKHGNKKF